MISDIHILKQELIAIGFSKELYELYTYMGSYYVFISEPYNVRKELSEQLYLYISVGNNNVFFSLEDIDSLIVGLRNKKLSTIR